MTDTTAPSLISFSIQDNTLQPGETLVIDYDATDAGSINSFYTFFYFYNEQGRSISIYALDFSGVANIDIHDQMYPGTYFAQEINLYDSYYSDDYVTHYNNSASYYRDGRLDGDVDSSTHDLDLSSLDFTIENNNTIDGEGPELVSFSIRDNTLQPGENLVVDYDATDASGIGSVTIYLNDELNNAFYASDYDGDGTVEFEITDKMLSGTYTVERLDVTDESYHQNHSYYFYDGVLSFNFGDSSTHNFDLSDLNFVVNNPNPADTEAPILVSFSIRDNILEPGDTLFVDYDATDASDIETVTVNFSNEQGRLIEMSTSGSEGVAFVDIHDQMFPGTYTAQSLTLTDQSYHHNYSMYNQDGSLESAVGSSTHDFDLSSLSFTVENNNTIDGEGPELVSVSIRDNTLQPGETLFIDYEVTDANDIDYFEFMFEDERNNHFFVYEDFNDGVLEYVIPDQMFPGTFTVQELNFQDESYHRNFSGYHQDGTLESAIDSSTHNFDLSKLNFVVENPNYFDLSVYQVEYSGSVLDAAEANEVDPFSQLLLSETMPTDAELRGVTPVPDETYEQNFFSGYNAAFFIDLVDTVESSGGIAKLFDESITALDSFDGTDFYIVSNSSDEAAGSSGSDIFVLGFGAGTTPTQSFYTNSTVNSEGVIDRDAVDGDLDQAWMFWLPEGVTVDMGAGEVLHVSGTETHRDYFGGIEYFSLTTHDDFITGGGGVDINWFEVLGGNDTIWGNDGDNQIHTILDYSNADAAEGIVVWNRGLDEGIDTAIAGDFGDHYNNWLPLDAQVIGADGYLIIDDAASFEGVVLDHSGSIDRYTDVDHFVGTYLDDMYLGGDGVDTFNAYFSSLNGHDYFDGGEGEDTLIVEDGLWNRGILGDAQDAAYSDVRKEIDFASVEVRATTTEGEFLFTGSPVDADNGYYDLETVVTNVERIDLREYTSDTEVYVIDSYEYLAYGQGDLGNMFYVTSLHHGEHDIHEVESISGEVLDNPNLAGSADIFYHGHHSDFDRTAEVTNWVATAVSATAAAASTNGNLEWQGHESMFFAWYDHDGEGGEAAYEIAVKYKDGEWRIENKVFDTFQDIALSTLSPEDLAALNAKSGAIDAGKHAEFDDTMSLRIKMAAAYDDITNIITSDADVTQWNFDQAKSTSRSTFYVDIPNGVGADGEWDGTMQQVKVDRVEDGVDDDGNVKYTWALDLEAQVLIKLPDVGNTLTTSDIIAGGDAAENITAGEGSDTMLGGGGADTYTISEGDASSDGPADAFGIVGDIINEIGGDLSSDAGDSVALAGLTGIDSVSFERTAIRFEDDEATLRMTTTNADGSSDVVHIFDHYNEDLPFRQVEQLLLDEGWEDDQIWNLVAGTSDGNGDILTGGAYRDVLVGGSGDDVLTSGGGIDVMQGGAGSDTFVLAESEYDGDIAGAHGNVTMIRDYVAGEDDIDLSLLAITDREGVSMETEGDRNYLVHTKAADNTTTVLAEFTHSSDLTSFNKDEDIKLSSLLDL